MAHPIAASLFYSKVPLTQPLTWRGEQKDQREAAIVQLNWDNGEVSWGEIAPLPGFSKESLQQAIDSARYHLRALLDQTNHVAPEPSVAFGIDCALQSIDIAAEPSQRAMLLQGEPAEILEKIELMPKLPRCIKLKVSRAPLPQEIKLLEAIQAQMPVTQIRLDANQGWKFEDALSFFRGINAEQLSFIEEPCDTLAATVCLGASGCPVALDEHLQDEMFTPTAFEGLRALVIKPTLVGSLARCQQLVDWAKQHKISVVVSASYESSLGTSQLAALAQRWAPSEIPGLDTLHYLQPHALPDTAGQNLPSHWQPLWQS
ncbi:o-succinylbenzoate synthase [Corallincola platygyrae]|uniref:o-succinylbenzoate synthase n=1 Tax=Corallincola platygyrae TaxID=1193278 RepID=A0ABW4XQE3_9GAMM